MEISDPDAPVTSAQPQVAQPEATLHESPTTFQTEYIFELKPNIVVKFESFQFVSRQLNILDGNKKPLATLTKNTNSEYKGNNYILSNGKSHDPIFSYTLTFANGRKLLLYCPIVYDMKCLGYPEVKIFIDHEGKVTISAPQTLNYFFGGINDKNSFVSGKVSAMKEGNSPDPDVLIDKSPIGANHEIRGDRIAMSTKRGFSHATVDEDAIGCARKSDGFREAIVDGMGGHPYPELAAGMVADSVLSAGGSLLDAFKKARNDLEFFVSLVKALKKPNAAMAAIDVSGDDLEIVSKGDVSVYVVDGDGKIIHATKQDNLAHELQENFNIGGWDKVFAWLRDKAPLKFKDCNDADLKFWIKENYRSLLSDITGTVLDDSEPHYTKMTLSKGCRVVLLSDGVPVSSDQIAKAVTGYSAEEGLKNIHTCMDELKRQGCYYVTIGEVTICIDFPHDDASVGVYVHA